MWGMGNVNLKNRRYCTMYKKVLYNIKKIKNKCGWEGEGLYLNQKHSQSIFKKTKSQKREKKMTEPGLETTTSVLEKPALVSTRLNNFKAITKYE